MRLLEHRAGRTVRSHSLLVTLRVPVGSWPSFLFYSFAYFWVTSCFEVIWAKPSSTTPGACGGTMEGRVRDLHTAHRVQRWDVTRGGILLVDFLKASPLHSARRASIGFTRAARRAGRYAAAIPLANRNMTAAAIVQPSCAFTP
jgi:hypothetical protein